MKKLISKFLICAMLFTLLPTAALAVVSYGIYIGGDLFTSVNAESGISLGDGQGIATYDPTTKTITFSGSTASEVTLPENEQGYSITGNQAKHVVLQDGISYSAGGIRMGGLSSSEPFVISGAADLECKLLMAANDSTELSGLRNVTITGGLSSEPYAVKGNLTADITGDLTLRSAESPAVTMKLTVKNAANVDVTGHSSACYGLTVEHCSGDVTVTQDTAASSARVITNDANVTCDGNFTINMGEGPAQSTDYAIFGSLTANCGGNVIFNTPKAPLVKGDASITARNIQMFSTVGCVAGKLTARCENISAVSTHDVVSLFYQDSELWIGGSARIAAGAASSSKPMTIKLHPIVPEGQTFASWYVKRGSSVTLSEEAGSDATLVIRDADDVEFRPVFSGEAESLTPATAGPAITPANGTYSGSVTVSMTPHKEDAKIHYTTDGSWPTAESEVYTAPFKLTKPSTVRALEVSDGWVSSTTTARYAITTAPDDEKIPSFSYDSDAALNHLGYTSYDACPISFWKGYIHFEMDDPEHPDTTLSGTLNGAPDALKDRVRGVWTNTETGLEAAPDMDVTQDENYHFVGPAVAGTYSFSLKYTKDSGEEVEVLPSFGSMTIEPKPFERITKHSEVDEAHHYAIVSEADGQLYVMSMYGASDGTSCDAIAVTPDESGRITLGEKQAMVFAPYHYAGAQRHYPRGDTSPDTLLWDLGTGTFGMYHVSGYAQEGSIIVSGGSRNGNKIGNYGGLVAGDDGTYLRFAENGAVTMRVTYHDEETALHMVKNTDGTFAFVTTDKRNDSRTSYPVWLYRRVLADAPDPTPTDKFDYMGAPLTKVYDGAAVSFNAWKDVEIFSADYSADWSGLDKMGVGRFVWRDLASNTDTTATSTDGENYTGPSAIGSYQLIYQLNVKTADGMVWQDHILHSFAIKDGTHTHVYDQETVADAYKKSDATCTAAAVYYKSCVCGEKGAETFTYGEPLSHTPDTEWHKDASGHWHECTACHTKADETAHTPGAAATGTTPQVCVICGYEIAPATGTEAPTVTFHANGGSVAPESMTVDAEGKGKLADLPTPTRSSYRFDGWFTSASGGTQVTADWVFTESTTLFAHWTYTGGGGSSGSSGSSSSGSTTTKTETTTNPDGSTTKTETKADGTTVETTTNTDGSTTTAETKTETKADGSTVETKKETSTAADGSKTETESKTETKADGSTVETRKETSTAADGTKTETEAKTEIKVDGTTTGTETKKTTDVNGSTGTTTTTTENGNTKTEAEAKISEKAVEDAKKNGAPVTAPVEVKAGENSDSAPTVKIVLPENAGKTKVEIPVSDVNSGTVAVIVHEDGTEEIVKSSTTTENGLQLKVDGSATIKVIDNSKTFDDTQKHWGRDEVNFVASRELFNGVGGSSFGVNEPMTRGMVNTVLARLAGVDTTTSDGSKWYEAGTAWAKDNGISDGTNPTENVTREQLATMLYRFAGSPEVSGELSFADADHVGGYAKKALLWAVQNGILNGIGDNLVAPKNSAERAQVAAMMARYLKNIG